MNQLEVVTLINKLVTQLESLQGVVAENKKQQWWADIQEAKDFIENAKTADQRTQAALVARSLLDNL